MISIFKENTILVIVLILLVLICGRIFKFLLSGHIITDMTKSKWIRDIPRNVLETQGDILPENLTGWFPLFASNDIKLNQVKGMHALGMDLLVFRSSSGKVRVLDAYCPHMGTYLPVGGKVVGESVRCPFHGWTFNGEGECTHVPGLDASSSPRVKIKTWISCEINGIIMFWYDSGDSPPTWMPKENKDVVNLVPSFKWTYTGFGHLLETRYNSVDFTHFDCLHKTIGFVDPESVFQQNLFYRMMCLVLNVDYRGVVKFDEKHIFSLEYELDAWLFGIHISDIVLINVVNEGPYLLNFSFKSKIFEFLSNTKILATVIPIPGRKFRITHYFYSKPTLFARIIPIVPILFSYFESVQVFRDGIIWSNKVMLKNPVFTKNEKYLVDVYRWSTQFYPKDKK